MNRLLVTSTIALLSILAFSGFAAAPPQADAVGCGTNNPPPCPCEQKCTPAGGGGGGGGGGGPVVPTTTPIRAGGSSKTPVTPSSMGSGSSGFTSSAGANGVWSGFSNTPGYTAAEMAGVNIMDRQVQFRRTDLDFSSNGAFGLTITRNYASAMTSYANNMQGNTMLGPNWLINYEFHLEEIVGTTDMGLRTESGQLIQLKKDGLTWRADADIMAATLTEVAIGNAAYRMNVGDGDAVYDFDVYGQPYQLKDRNGNYVEFTYAFVNGFRRISRITASAPDNRYLDFAYYTNGRLKTITPSWSTRGVLYTYTSDSALADQRLKTIYDSSGRIIEEYELELGIAILGDPHFFRIKQPTSTGTTNTLVTFEIFEQHPYWTLNAVYNGAGTKVLEQDPSYAGIWRVANGSGTFTNTRGLRVDTTMHVYAPPLMYHYMYDNTGTPQLVRTDRQELSISQMFGTWSGSYRQLGFTRGNDVISTSTYYSDTVQSANFDYTRLYKQERLGHLPEYYYYNSLGRLTGRWQAEDRHTSMTYDNAGNLHTITNAAGETTTYNVDSYGRTLSVQTALGTTSYVHSPQGKLLETTDVGGFKTCYEYDSRFRKTAVGSRGTTTTYAYDDYDRLTTTTDHIGNKTVYTYDSRDRLITVTDPMLNSTHYQYNEATGALTSVTDAALGVTSYEYDIWGRMTKLIDPRNKSTLYTYDYLGRIATETNPILKTWTYAYDDAGGCGGCGSGGAGHLASVRDPDNRYTYYAYDTADRLKKVTYSGVTDEVEYFYDAYGRRVRVYDNRLAIGDKSFHYSYDANDRVTSETYPDNATIRYTYDNKGRRTSIIDPDGNTTTYEYYDYADNKKLAYFSHPFAPYTVFDYNTNGLLSQMTYSATYIAGTTFNYDALNRVDLIYHENIDYASAMQMESYTYNANSMRTRVDYLWDPTPNHRLFDYDPLLRLKDEHSVDSTTDLTRWRRQYTYDAAGNRTQLVNNNGSATVTTNYTYNDFNQLIYNTDHDFGYDNNGNLKTRGGDGQVYYDHNRENRLTDYRASVNTTSYTYDYLGRRIQRTAPNGDKMRYYYDGINVLITKEQPTGTSIWRTKNVYALKQSDIGQIIGERTNTGWSGTTPTAWEDRSYRYDLLGNVTLKVDETGMTIVEQPEMEAFGNVLTGSQAGYHLTTKEYDSDSGLYYFSARWYNAMTSQWIEAEPLSNGSRYHQAVGNSTWRLNPIKSNVFMLDPQRWNYYGFNLNSPSEYYDPDGRLSQKTKDTIEKGVEFGAGAALGYCCFPALVVYLGAKGVAHFYIVYQCGTPDSVIENIGEVMEPVLPGGTLAPSPTR